MAALIFTVLAVYIENSFFLLILQGLMSQNTIYRIQMMFCPDVHRAM